jgi:hypothetical protein
MLSAVPMCLTRRATRTGDHGESRPVVKPINLEIPLVHGKDLPDSFPFGDSHECCIGEIHWTVCVLPHQLSHPGHIIEIKR